MVRYPTNYAPKTRENLKNIGNMVKPQGKKNIFNLPKITAFSINSSGFLPEIPILVLSDHYCGIKKSLILASEVLIMQPQTHTQLSHCFSGFKAL